MVRCTPVFLAAAALCVGAQAVQAEGFDMRPVDRILEEGMTAGDGSPVEGAAASAITASLPAAAPIGPSDARAEAKTASPAGLRGLIARHAQENGVPVGLAEAVVRVESRFNPSARNGPYMGLMQIHPRTARGVGYGGAPGGLLHADTNLRYGMRYLGQAYRLASGDTCRTVMKYQSGHGAQRLNAANLRYCAKVRQHIAAR